jgi:hypothetical protein
MRTFALAQSSWNLHVIEQIKHASQTFIVFPLIPIINPTSVFGTSNSYIGRTSGCPNSSTANGLQDVSGPVARPLSAEP